MNASPARRVEPEWLDLLPPADPRALRSRRELVRVNALMANAGILARLLRAANAPFPRSLVELGSGDGRFALRLARALGPPPPGASFTLVDRQSSVDPEAARALAALGWEVRAAEADVFDFLASSTPCDAIVANLFLHHFEAPALSAMLDSIAARAQCFAACEPRRSRLAAAGSRLLGLVGCGPVTRHDAIVSVRAGFRGRELASLWPAGREWVLEEGARGLFSHAFLARRP